VPVAEASLDETAPFAAVRVRTVLPQELATRPGVAGQLSTLNAFAALFRAVPGHPHNAVPGHPHNCAATLRPVSVSQPALKPVICWRLQG
jgi:hypothetical protein